MPRSMPASMAKTPEDALEDDVVDIWCADTGCRREGVAGLLSSEEIARSERFRRAEDRDRWIHARAILRLLLARYTAIAAPAIRLRAGPYGKPELDQGPRDLRFSLSHAGRIAVYGFARGSEIGVDVEMAGRPIDPLGIAARALGAEVRGELERLDPPGRERAFLRRWVRHEAVLKCRGTGFAGAAAPASRGPSPWVVELDIGVSGAFAALAVEAGPRRLRPRSWAIPGES